MNEEINSETDPERCRRKANQHWDMAGLARQDRDYKDEKRHTELARAWSNRLKELTE